MPNIKMGVCDVTFGTTPLGHTKGGVRLSYKVESEAVGTDQSDAPVDVIITGQPAEVTVPMAEHQLEILAQLIPNAALIIDSINPEKMRLEISGEAGSSLKERAQMLTIAPRNGTPNDTVVFYHAVAIPEFDIAFEKGTNIRIYNVRFQALQGENGYIAIGDQSVQEA
jgi:hypothetical protein